jgi:hypothetical protein
VGGRELEKEGFMGLEKGLGKGFEIVEDIQGIMTWPY